MKSKKQTLSSGTASPWVPVNHRGHDFGIGFGCTVSNSGTMIYLIEHTFDDLYNPIPVSITRSTTTATVTYGSPHGRVVGDSINITGTRESNLAGYFSVASVPSTTTLTYTVSDTGSAAESAEITGMNVFPHDTVTGQTSAADGGYDLPCTAVRARISAYTDGVLTVNWVFKD